jgi:dTMP kinase
MIPKFITFEGGEGSGKTTQSKRFFEYLKSQNIKCIWTREIGGTTVAEKIRDIILYNEMDHMTELLLIMAARKEHVDKVILPALKSGVTVICDRFIDSTFCYQGAYIGREKILQLHEFVIGDLYPDRTFFIDVPAVEGLKRACARGGNNKFEDKDISEHDRIRDEFLVLVKMFPKRIVKIDGMQSEDEVSRGVIEVYGKN